VTPLIATVAAPTHRHRECSKTDFFNGIAQVQLNAIQS
jgi:hypothetical protein